MKASELKGQTDEQLSLALTDTEKHLFQLRFQSATDRLETPSEIAKARKDIARVKTEQRRRELAKLANAGSDELTRLQAEAEGKTQGPGKRKAKRDLGRLAALQVAAAVKNTKTQPAKGK